MFFNVKEGVLPIPEQVNAQHGHDLSPPLPAEQIPVPFFGRGFSKGHLGFASLTLEKEQ